MFEFFDRSEDYAVTHGNLPHWHQPGATCFVTFRTDDSIPQALLRAWHRDREGWLRNLGIDRSAGGWKELRLSPDLESEYHARFTRKFMKYLDRGLGACVLRQSPLARIVGDALEHFDGRRYHLGDYVVMPNHVHALFCPLAEYDVEAICESWKHFTARKINAALGMRGRFWQEESFDHLVRSAEHFAAFQRYIADNPRRAGLPEGKYLLRSL